MRMKALLISVAALFVVSAARAQTPTPTQPELYTIAGWVLNGSTNAGIASVLVDILNVDTAVTVHCYTALDGSFSKGGLLAGSYTVALTKTGSGFLHPAIPENGESPIDLPPSQLGFVYYDVNPTPAPATRTPAPTKTPMVCSNSKGCLKDYHCVTPTSPPTQTPTPMP